MKFVNKNKAKSITDFVLANDNRIYRFSGSRSNIIPKQTINLCANKYKTKVFLQENDINVPKGRLFEKGDSDEEIIEFVKEFQFPVVVKPYNGTGGDGVVLNINNIDSLRKSLLKVRKQLHYPNVIIERFIPSIDYQLYIVGH